MGWKILFLSSAVSMECSSFWMSEIILSYTFHFTDDKIKINSKIKHLDKALDNWNLDWNLNSQWYLNGTSGISGHLENVGQ